MRGTRTIGILGSLLATGAALANEPFATMPEPGAPPQIEMVAATTEGVRLVVSIPEFRVEEVSSAQTSYQVPVIPGCRLDGAPGEPALPIFSRLLAVPEGAEVRVRAFPLEEEVLTNIRALEVPAVAEPEIWSDRTRSNASGADKDDLVTVAAPARLRGLRVVPLNFRPVRYDAERQELRVARSLQVEIDFHGGETRSELDTAPAMPSSFDRLCREVVLNYPEPLAAAGGIPGTYLVICPNNSAIEDALQALLDWRRRQGFRVQLATTLQTGTSASQIQSFIQSVYDDPGSSLEYVVLVGDATGSYMLPTWVETLTVYHGEGDLPYSRLAGADVLPDVHLGRLSIDDPTALGEIVQKIVNYESAPYIAEPDWFVRSTIVGDPVPSGVSCIDAGRWLARRLQDIGFAEADTIFSGNFALQMVDGLNRGCSIWAYRGIGGMSGWSNAYAYVSTNTWKMPFVVTLTCDTGSFASGTSTTEAFLRAWDSANARPRGGIGAIGLATIGTHTRYNNCLFFGIFRGLVQEQQYTMGGALTRGCLEMYLNYWSAEPQTVETWCHWANLMGDPAVPVWTAYPESLTVTHPTGFVIGENSLTVTVEEAGSPVDAAQICLWKGEEVHVVGLSDAFGEIELPLDAMTAGDLLLTVTKHNKHPYLATIPVAGTNLYVGYASSNVDDDSSGESSGNADGIVNPGETIELAVQLENFGSQSAASVHATLSTDDPYVTLHDDQEDFGSMAGGATAWGGDDFDFTLASDCPDGHLISFGLEVTSGIDEWHSLIELPVASASFVSQSTTVYDGNARLDPGDTAELSVLLQNDGGTAGTSVTGTLVSLSSYVTVSDGSGSFGTISAGSTGENTADRFTVSVGADVYDGYLASFQLLTSFSGGMTDTTEVTLTVGSRSSTDPVGPDLHGYLAYDNTDTSYPETPTYSWIELDPAYGGDGTEIILQDAGEYLDASQVLDLPFPFVYYGETHTQATVCSNGWVAMGATPLFTYRNWTIPGGGGPNGMLAVYWDNLYQVSESKVFHKYDAANHRWIVEWSRMRTAYGSWTETFEVIIYDPAYHPTETGDGLIVYQYHTVTLVDPINGYATVGIESPDQLDGVLYTYFNHYSDGAAALTAGRAIRFVPTMEGPSGTLAGNVLNASNGDTPIPHAQIEVLDAGRVFNTTVAGTYSGPLAPGTYTVVASHGSFAPDTTTGVIIEQDLTTPLDFHLTDITPPVITTTQYPWTDDTTGPYAIPITILEHSALTETSFYYRVGDGEFIALTLQPQGGDQYLAEIPGQPLSSRIRYYVYAQDAPGLESFSPPTAPATPHLFAVVPMDTIFADDFETDQGWIIGAPGDDAIFGIWVREEPVGTTYNSHQIQPEYDHTASPGEICFVTGNGEPGEDAGENDVDYGKTTLFSPVIDLSGSIAVSASYWLWYSNEHASNPSQDPWIVKVTGNGVDWITLENTTASTNENWVQRNFLLDDYIDLTDQVQFRMVARDDGGGSLVEAAIDDFVIVGTADVYTGVETLPAVVVRENGLDPCRPNPFRHETRVSYRIVQPGSVSLRIYDVAGRLVRTLAEGRVDAGEHHVLWNGKNTTGKRVAAGVYFVRLNSPEFSKVQRTILLR